MLEYEKKILLTEKEYRFLLRIFAHDVTTIVQRNDYFDTDDFQMNEKGITCRVRQKGDTFFAVMKTHERDSNCSSEMVISKSSMFDPHAFANMGLRWQGFLLTERKQIYKDEFYEIVLDCNRYGGTTDYELEIEYAPELENQADGFLRRIGQLLVDKCITDDADAFVRRSEHAKSKSERFFNQLQK